MTAVVRGPNVNLLDHVEPIRDDPLFNSWRNPVPPEWFSANQKAYTLVDQEALYGSVLFVRIFARSATDSISAPTDSVDHSLSLVRNSAESMTTPIEFVNSGATVQQIAIGATRIGSKPIT